MENNDVLKVSLGDAIKVNEPKVYEELTSQILQKEKNNITEYAIRRNGKNIIKLPLFTAIGVLLIGANKPKLSLGVIMTMLALKADLVFIRRDKTEISVKEELKAKLGKAQETIKETAGELEKGFENKVFEIKEMTAEKVSEIKGATKEKIGATKYFTIEL